VGQKSKPVNEPAEQIMKEIHRATAVPCPPPCRTSPTPDHYLSANPASISVANQRLVTAIVEGGRRCGRFLVEKDHTATQDRGADTCAYGRSDRISRRIATHRMSEPITKIKRLIGLRQRTRR
jgi:hypothetical protein